MATFRYSLIALLGLTTALAGCVSSSCGACSAQKDKGVSCLAQGPKKITSFEECVAAGFPMLKTYPGRCVTDSGETFTDTGAEKVIPPTTSLGTGNKICVDQCGDGTCAEMVCLAEGCPCAESHQTCPQDCK
jgi:hypothetical protein